MAGPSASYDPSYELKAEDVAGCNKWQPNAIVRAAALPSPTALVHLLARTRAWRARNAHFDAREAEARGYPDVDAYEEDPIHGRYLCPLDAAIAAGSRDSVHLLLQAGSDPNGFPVDVFARFATFYLRFRHAVYGVQLLPLSSGTVKYPEALARMPHPQTAPLTEAEAEFQRQPGRRCRFWTEPAFPWSRLRRECPPWANHVRTPIESAVLAGDAEAVRMLITAGADVSFWLDPRSVDPPDVSTPSSLSVSSPLHAAVVHAPHLLPFLLQDCRLDPNIVPATAPTVARTPAMLALAQEPGPDLDAFATLAADPRTDLSVRTPMFGLHVLHVAVATLALSSVETCTAFVPLASAGATAQGLSVLHIACLPLHAAHIAGTLSASRSVHHLRSLSRRRYGGEGLRAVEYQDLRADLPETDMPPADDADAQTVVITHILDSLVGQRIGGATALWTQPDGAGNTPLHYLAAYRTPNLETIERGRREAPEAWQEARNVWGHTPAELFKDGQQAKRAEERSRHDAGWMAVREARQKEQTVWRPERDQALEQQLRRTFGTTED